MRNLKYQHIFQLYLGLIAFVICAFPHLITVAILGLLVFVILGYIKKQIVFNFNKPAFFLALLYILYLVGVFFTQNQKLANSYIENKLSLLVFPLLLSFRFKKEMDFRPVVIGLVSGVFVTSIIGFMNAFSCQSTVDEPTFLGCFTSSGFSNIHHPSYFSVFILIAMTAVWFAYFNRWKYFKLIWIIPFSLYSLLIYGLCMSLAGLLFLFLLSFVLLLIWIYKRFGKLTLFISIVVLPFIGGMIFLSVPQLKLQFEDAKRFLLEYTKSPDSFVKSKKTAYVEGNEIRLIMWTISAQELGRHPFGVGTGNVDLHLSYRLNQAGLRELGKQDENHTILYNPHNQFLQTGMETGIQGLAVLLLMVISAIFYAWKKRNWVLLVLMSGFIFNSLFESMLQRQSGIVFYSFWICILIVYSSSKPNKTEISA